MDARKRRNANTHPLLSSPKDAENEAAKGRASWKRMIIHRFIVMMLIFIGMALLFLQPFLGRKHEDNFTNSIEESSGIRIRADSLGDHTSPTIEESSASTTHSSANLRFVTVVDSGSEVNPDGRHDRLLSIQSTWGPAARVIFVVNNVTEFPQAPVMSTSTTSNQNNEQQQTSSYPQLLPLPPGTADRSIAALQYTIRTILRDINPEFALFTNCHTFVIPEHVCHFLNDKSPSEHLYAGHALNVGGTKIFHPASSGYVLSRTTMQGLVQQWDDGACRTERSHPGFFISECLKNVFHVRPMDTTLDDGQQFHSFPLIRLISGDVDDWYKKMSAVKFVGGVDCCSHNTISFHYMEAPECRALYATLKYNINFTKDDESLKKFMIDTWPTSIG
eukprot:CAMPEP_0194240452 /NCGR_PEP_ID=MMETSP0158-20130606/6617_1 /TAXON_ID=33649 /ORGANISM="Thalassionema nitzschioides, Strain L26-B" /LENGTH=389 /DNA_ID=CAMNT_0038975147 /DNA_START=43 /DNA_END=1209 /DNA_ORIENTATION=+